MTNIFKYIWAANMKVINWLAAREDGEIWASLYVAAQFEILTLIMIIVLFKIKSAI